MRIMIASLAVSTVWLLATAGNASPAPYSFTQIVDDYTARPDGKGNFNLEYYWPPSLDGSTVLLLDAFNALTFPLDSIWATTVGSRRFTRLVAAGDPAPGGTGAFAQLSAPIGATAKNGVVVFESLDQTGQGVYTIPVSGGAPRLVINYKSNFPDGAQFGIGLGLAEDTMVGIATDGAHVAINTSRGRLLVAGLDGSHVTESVDTANIGSYPLSPNIPLGVGIALAPPSSCPYLNETAPIPVGVAISGDNLVFVGSGPEASVDNNAVYRTPITGFPAGLPTCSDYGLHIEPPLLADALTPLPGDPQAASTDDVIQGFVLDAAEVAYVITDANDGYQCVMLAGTDGKTTVPVACSATLLPGMKTLPLQFYGVSLRDQTLVFAARDAAHNVGLYSYQGGAVGKIVASGDKLSGSPVLARAQEPDLDIGPTATSAGGVAFNAITGNWLGAYVARPAACATDVTAKLAIAEGPIESDGAGRFTQLVSLTNVSGAPLQGTLALALDNLKGAKLTGGASTSCATPGGRPVVIADLGPGQVLASGKSVKVALTFAGNLPITYQASVLQGFRR